MEPRTSRELTAVGRDREAVVAALAEWQAAPTTRGGTGMDGVQQLEEVIPVLRDVLKGVTDLGAPTPCDSFTVTGVLEHMIGGATAFAPAFRGGPSPALPDGDVVERWQAAMTELLYSVHADGARERTIPTPFGEMPGESFARYVAFDGIVHAWDLARASGQLVEPRPELVAEIDAYARGLIGPAMRDGDTFKDETVAPKGSSPLDRLAAFSGRTV